MSFPRLGRRAALSGAAAVVAAGSTNSRVARAAEVNGVIIGRDGYLFATWESIRRGDPAMVGRVVDTLMNAVGLLKQAGIQVAISVTPGKARIYRNFLPDDMKWAPEADRRYPLIVSLFRKGGVIAPDQGTLFGTLHQQHPDISYWFKADTHWTAVAAEQSARLMASELKPAIHLPPATRPGTQLGPIADVIQEHNDLALLLPTAQQSSYPFEHYPVRKPVAAGGSGLLDDDTADVLVIGNSYMQPAYGYANVLSEQLGRPTSLYWKVHQQSLYFTMLAYLKSESFKKQRPKLIVWNMAENDFEVDCNNPGAWGQTAMPVATFLGGLKQALT